MAKQKEELKGKFVQNTTDASYALEVRNEGELAPVMTKVFRPETINGQDGKVLHNGFTFITTEELKMLQEKTRFNRYIEKELFKLHDTLPDEVVTLDEKYATLLQENATLKSGEELEALRAKVAELSTENASLKKQLEDVAKKQAKTEKDK